MYPLENWTDDGVLTSVLLLEALFFACKIRTLAMLRPDSDARRPAVTSDIAAGMARR
jgi:hypothetical protein